jgi:hypothetical protein
LIMVRNIEMCSFDVTANIRALHNFLYND